MRTKKSLNNIVFITLGNLINSILAFLCRTIFISVLGSTYLGVNGLIGNVLSMLSLTELGVSSAISFSLYKPLANNEEDKITSLMQFYKKAYRVIGFIVFGLGILIMPFLSFMIKGGEQIENLYLIYFIYLINTAYSYLFSYKRTLITADQKAYKLVPFTTGFKIFGIVLQILSLIIFKSFIVYLLAQMIGLFVENLAINRYLNKEYPILLRSDCEKVEKKELSVIVRNIKAMMIQKIGEFCINSTDNFIISYFINITMVGIYSNYLMIINIMSQFVMIFYSSITASLGNLIVTESREKRFEIFKVIDFLSFWIYGFISVGFYNLMNSFIELWIGKEHLLSQEVVIVITLNYYLMGIMMSIISVKGAAGLYNEDKYVSIIQAIINLICSIVLVKYIGIIGVFLGTLISILILPSWYRPLIVYKNIFKRSVIEYYARHILYFFIVIFSVFITSSIINYVTVNLTWINFIINMIISFIIPNVLILLLFWRTEEMKYLRFIIKGIIKKEIV